MTTTRSRFAAFRLLALLIAVATAFWRTFHPYPGMTHTSLLIGIPVSLIFFLVIAWSSKAKVWGTALVLLCLVCWRAPGHLSDSIAYGTAVWVSVLTVSCVGAFIYGFGREATRNRSADGPAASGDRMIVGLSGYAGSGKDTAAQGLVWHGWTRVSFADKIRNFCYAQNPIIVVTPDDHLYLEVAALRGNPVPPRNLYFRLQKLVDTFGWERVKYETDEGRRLLQVTGADAGRNVVGENVWVDSVMRTLPSGNIVFTDMRFPNEAAAIEKVGGKTIRVTRPGVKPVNPHPSETMLDDWHFDGKLDNSGSTHNAGVALRQLVAYLF